MARPESTATLRALKMLASGEAKSISEAARLAGVSRSTIQRANNRRQAQVNNQNNNQGRG